ncbi:hypothetical protein QO019_002274 [Streptomyces thermodiastaticus]|uniref:DNA-directed RNA polymerase specialized sigma24 family protein n=1 Tax=Streptomyces thermodiastaticus TaxID=44061 RepID=A0ABU0KDL0_9ACTN|nr:hypothetical protein [Streptomyces thermodiastaticus]UVT09439.1 hypothetical protein AY578_09085 [Streptomyces thermocarboxydus]WSB41102.1 hypothetical protein OG853_09595 [Streptomyces cellulosae]WTF20106.1 hypothetical protein OH750_09590 [Streptomyces cellulosae]
MQSQDAAAQSPAPSSTAGPAVDVEQAEAALVEHYPRLVRLAYVVLPSRMSRTRRVLTAHALVQRALPRGRADAPLIPAQSAGRDGDPGYALVRLHVVRSALEAGLPLRRRGLPKRAQLPPLLPQVWGLQVFPRPGGAEELALDQRLSALSGPARAAHALRGLELLPDADVRRVLDDAGVADPDAALAEADSVPDPYRLLESPEFDPCALQARPTDLLRRRRHLKATLVGAAALAVCGALLSLPGDGWGADGPAAPPYARNAAAQAALDPAKLTRAPASAWQTSARTDFSVWPARGTLTGDRALLRRALAVWARPGEGVTASATPGTPSGGPAGPPQLLYAGTVDAARVVILYDGWRLARYAEPEQGERGAVLDLARVDGAGRAGASAVVLSRSDGNVRFLLAPWVREAGERDLRDPDEGAKELPLQDGVTGPFLSGQGREPCTAWNALELTDGTDTRLFTDLGELVPARLTTGRPGEVKDVSGAKARHLWEPYACSLAVMRSAGVRSVNAWAYAEQPLPGTDEEAEWLCTRGETWRGTGARVLAQFRSPGARYGAVAARAENVPACGKRQPDVLAGVLWKSADGTWHLLAAGSDGVTSVEATGDVEGKAKDRMLSVRAEKGARADLKGTLEDGGSVGGLR